MRETRYIWAGFEGRDGAANPTRDLRASASARDLFAPGVNAGALIAPLELPFELAVAVSYAAGHALERDGAVEITPARDAAFPHVVPETSRRGATIELPGRVAARTGVRYLGDRVLGEVDTELVYYTGGGGTEPVWTLAAPVAVGDDSGVVAELDQLPSAVTMRDHFCVRGAVDVDVVRGFVSLSAGYAFRRRRRARAGSCPAGPSRPCTRSPPAPKRAGSD
jgi:hypothetical protein